MSVRINKNSLGRTIFGSVGLTLMFTLCLTTVGCQTSPTGRKQLMFIPEEKLDGMGVQSFDEMKKKQTINHDPRLNAYVKCVANAITSVLPERQKWEVVVFETAEPNAFALPGGKIGVNSGILKIATTQSELGTVLGHEVGHVLAKHGNERLSDEFLEQGGLKVIDAIAGNPSSPAYARIAAALAPSVAQYGINLPYSRAQETEADIIGLDLMSKAGFDPAESVNLWKNMLKLGGKQPPEFVSDHPIHEDRIKTLEEHMSSAEANYKAAPTHPHCVM